MNPEHHEPGACQDCGIPDMLDSAGACPSCATERQLDMGRHYDAKDNDREWWDRYAFQPTDKELA
jgi:hypothetical protein